MKVHEWLTTRLLPKLSHISGFTRTPECPYSQNTGLDFLGSWLCLTLRWGGRGVSKRIVFENMVSNFVVIREEGGLFFKSQK